MCQCSQQHNYMLLSLAPGKLSVSDNTNGIHSAHSKQVIFWKCFCYGVSIALGAKFWDNTVSDFRRLFQETMTDPSTKVCPPPVVSVEPCLLRDDNVRSAVCLCLSFVSLLSVTYWNCPVPCCCWRHGFEEFYQGKYFFNCQFPCCCHT